MRRKTIYIAGPMTGIKDDNFPAFFASEGYLEVCGHNPVNPAKHQPVVVCPVTCKAHTMSYKDFLNLDLEIIATACDAVAVLPGWGRSPGARKEVKLALDLGLEIVEL